MTAIARLVALGVLLRGRGGERWRGLTAFLRDARARPIGSLGLVTRLTKLPVPAVGVRGRWHRLIRAGAVHARWRLGWRGSRRHTGTVCELFRRMERTWRVRTTRGGLRTTPGAAAPSAMATTSMCMCIAHQTYSLGSTSLRKSGYSAPSRNQSGDEAQWGWLREATAPYGVPLC